MIGTVGIVAGVVECMAKKGATVVPVVVAVVIIVTAKVKTTHYVEIDTYGLTSSFFPFNSGIRLNSFLPSFLPSPFILYSSFFTYLSNNVSY